MTYREHSKITLAHLSNFYAAIRADYPDAETVYVAQDNWHVHVHADVLERLQDQHSPFLLKVPANWSDTPRTKAVHDDLPIQMVFLLTYASWLNPIEKL